MKIYLIGMPAAGKTTLGEALACRLKLEFIDLEQYIEYKCTMFIDEIYDAYGSEWLMAMEANTLKELKDKDNIVIATSSDIVMSEENKLLMNGKIIYLYAPVLELEKRIEPDETSRKLVLDNKIGQMYLERKDKYEQFADHIIDNTDMTKAIEEIMEALK